MDNNQIIKENSTNIDDILNKAAKMSLEERIEVLYQAVKSNQMNCYFFKLYILELIEWDKKRGK